MSYVTQRVSMESDELTFVKAFIESFTSADERISLITDLEDLEDEFNDSNARPTFEFQIGDFCRITFMREFNIGTAAQGYYVTLAAENTVTYADRYVCVSSSTASDDVVLRAIDFIIIANDKIINIRFPHDSSLAISQSVQLSLIVVKQENAITSNSIICGYSNSVNTNIMSTVWSGNGFIGDMIKTDRLAYTYDSVNITTIETVKSKVFLTDGTTNKRLTINSLYDTSSMASDILFTIDEKRYYSLDAHTIMRC